MHEDARNAAALREVQWTSLQQSPKLWQSAPQKQSPSVAIQSSPLHRGQQLVE